MKHSPLVFVIVLATAVMTPTLARSQGSAPPKKKGVGTQSARSAASPALRTAFGRLVRVERSDKTSVSVLYTKGGARSEIRKADGGKTFLILHFAGKTKLDLGAGSSAGMKRFMASLGVSAMVRKTDQSILTDGNGNKNADAFVVNNALSRTLAFEIPAEANGFTWSDKSQTFKLEPTPALIAGNTAAGDKDKKNDSSAKEPPATNQSKFSRAETAKPPTTPTKALPNQEAFDALRQLNDERKLFPLSLFGAAGSVDDLAPENCFGFVLNGARLVGESSGKNYGVQLSTGDDFFVVIGSLYSDTDFQVEDHLFKKGPHLVLTGLKHIRIIGDGEGFTTMGVPGGSKQVPSMESHVFPAKSPIDPSLVGKDSKARIKFSLMQEKGGVFINVGGNKLAVKVR